MSSAVARIFARRIEYETRFPICSTVSSLRVWYCRSVAIYVGNDSVGEEEEENPVFGTPEDGPTKERCRVYESDRIQPRAKERLKHS